MHDFAHRNLPLPGFAVICTGPMLGFRAGRVSLPIKKHRAQGAEREVGYREAIRE